MADDVEPFAAFLAMRVSPCMYCVALQCAQNHWRVMGRAPQTQRMKWERAQTGSAPTSGCNRRNASKRARYLGPATSRLGSGSQRRNRTDRRPGFALPHRFEMPSGLRYARMRPWGLHPVDVGSYPRKRRVTRWHAIGGRVFPRFSSQPCLPTRSCRRTEPFRPMTTRYGFPGAAQHGSAISACSWQQRLLRHPRANDRP